MSFIWPELLLLLPLVPLLVVLYIVLQRQRQQRIQRFSRLPFLQRAVGQRFGLRQHIPPALFLASLTILLIAMARPQTVLSLPKVQGTIILAFDVSGSMAADDLKPTRLDAAKVAARDFVERQPSTVQIGVVAFSDNGFSVQTTSYDQEAVLAAINRLTPQRGTSIANGIVAALSAIAVGNGQDQHLYSKITPAPTPSPTPVPKGTYTPAVIVLLTDGENNESPDPLAAAQAAADRGVRIYTVGIGSPAGTTLHINGFTVHTQLDAATLQQIAQITGGKYYSAENAQQLRTIYDNLNTQLVTKPEETEVTSLFAGASLLVLLIAGALSLVWFNRLP